VVAATDSGREPVTVAPLFLGLIEGAIDPLEQHDEALPGSPLGYPLAQGEVGGNVGILMGQSPGRQSGAMIIREGKIKAAGCVLPLSRRR
jgi:hypothetical protein